MNFKRFPHSISRQVDGKPFQVFWSKSADKALQKLQQPLYVEMELKFACMVRMHVYFHDQLEDITPISITDKLAVFYRPVIGQSCDIGNGNNTVVMGDLTTGPMANRFPKKLGIDYVKGNWVGKFS